MKKAARICIILGMILRAWRIAPIIVGAIALKRLKTAQSKSELVTIAIFNIIFNNPLAGIFMLLIPKDDYKEAQYVSQYEKYANASADFYLDEIEKLNDLRKAELLSEEDYELKKRALLYNFNDHKQDLKKKRMKKIHKLSRLILICTVSLYFLLAVIIAYYFVGDEYNEASLLILTFAMPSMFILLIACATKNKIVTIVNKANHILLSIWGIILAFIIWYEGAIMILFILMCLCVALVEFINLMFVAFVPLKYKKINYGDVSVLLKRIKDLKDDGALTEEEFEETRKVLARKL